MIVRAVIAAAVALLPIGASAAPVDAAVPCLAQANALLDTLRPFAEQIAGKSLDVTVDSNADDLAFLARTGAPAEYLLARTYFFVFKPYRDRIRIAPKFCALSPADQRVTLAHELGHGIDRVTMYEWYGNTDQALWPDWDQRPPEISATARALQIYRLAGFDPAEFMEVWPTSIYGRHVEQADSGHNWLAPVRPPSQN